jgi:hypothetical protein
MLGTSSENVQVPGTLTVNGNSTIGTSSSNTSTFNAIPNFVNGFKCAGTNAYNLVMGIATYVDGSSSNYGDSQIPSGQWGSATYTLDQDVTYITGCFISSQNNNFNMWFYQSISSTQVELMYTNMSGSTETIPQTVAYMIFGTNNIT